LAAAVLGDELQMISSTLSRSNSAAKAGSLSLRPRE
jgi:hypothetical protein